PEAVHFADREDRGEDERGGDRNESDPAQEGVLHDEQILPVAGRGQRRFPTRRASYTFAPPLAESCPSGLRSTLGKRVCGKPYPGFESLTLRQFLELAAPRKRRERSDGGRNAEHASAKAHP